VVPDVVQLLVGGMLPVKVFLRERHQLVLIAITYKTDLYRLRNASDAMLKKNKGIVPEKRLIEMSNSLSDSKDNDCGIVPSR